jgi:hypothetical protein
LPATYRPTSISTFIISETSLAIGSSSGRVIFLTITEQSPVPMG